MNLFNQASDFSFYSSGVKTPQASDLIFLVKHNKIYIINNSIPLLKDIQKLSGYSVDKLYFFGSINQIDCYCCIENDMFDLSNDNFTSIRSSFNLLALENFQATLLANHLTHWLESHQYCGKCGGKNNLLSHEYAMQCTSCEFTSYTKVSPCVIAVIYQGDKILLAKNKNATENIYSCIAGFVNPGENLETALARETQEEVGLKIKNIQYIASQQWPFPSSLMMGFLAEYDSGEITVDYNELADAKWVNINELNTVKLPTEISIASHLIHTYHSLYKSRLVNP